MDFRYRRGCIFLPLRHRQAHPLCAQSRQSEQPQQQQCQQYHARQYRQSVVLHFRKRARPLPQGKQRLWEFRRTERRAIQRLYLWSIRVIHTERRPAADYESGILPVWLPTEEVLQLRYRERIPADCRQRERIVRDTWRRSIPRRYPGNDLFLGKETALYPQVLQHHPFPSAGQRKGNHRWRRHRYSEPVHRLYIGNQSESRPVHV